jgi:hypothetical protein
MLSLFYGRRHALHYRHARFRSAPHGSAWVSEPCFLRSRCEKAARARASELKNPNLLHQTRGCCRASAAGTAAHDNCRQLPVLATARGQRFWPTLSLIGLDSARQAVEFFFFRRTGFRICKRPSALHQQSEHPIGLVPGKSSLGHVLGHNDKPFSPRKQEHSRWRLALGGRVKPSA